MEASQSTSENQKIKSRARPRLALYASLLDSFRDYQESSSSSPIERSKLSLKKLLITKRFARIGEDIIQLGQERNTNHNSGEFFSDILLFEAKRLAFKEEALKCQTTIDQTQV